MRGKFNKILWESDKLGGEKKIKESDRKGERQDEPHDFRI